MAPSALDRHIAQTFQRVGVRFHHAENLHDFSVYCHERALLARAELRKLSAEFTTFYSDQSDEERGALSRVFGNLRDFGTIFACGRGTVPNVYGPIHLVFRPGCFAQMSDIVITKRSIVSIGDGWRDEGANTIQTIDRIASGRPVNGHISGDWKYAELSCAESRLSFDFLEEVIVEPISLSGRQLVDIVRAELHTAGIREVRVSPRSYRRSKNLAAMQELVAFCERLPDALHKESPQFRKVAELPSFADHPENRRGHLKLWARYFYFGTAKECRARDQQISAMIAAADAADSREPCELCDPSENQSPAMVSFRPFYIDGVRSMALEEGICDSCKGTTLKCLHCGALTPIWPRPGRHEIECEGGCGIKFAATHTATSTGTNVDIGVVDAINPANLAEELAAIVQERYEDDFVQSVLEGEYPVCDVELDQLEVALGTEPGVARVEWGFGASHHSEDGIYFGGVVTASLTFDATAATRAVLSETVEVDNVSADFGMDDDEGEENG